jgi:phage/plasmid-like protein (TIGR03299 family)
MTHELAFQNGKAQIAYTSSGGVPWHGLGTPCGDHETPEELQRLCGADFRVEKQELFRDVDGTRFKSCKRSLVRTDTNQELDVVGADWNPLQNDDAFRFFQEFIEAGDMKMETAGVLKGGRMVWALAKLDAGFTLLKVDRIDSYMLFANPHQFGKGISIRMTPIRVVCWNTISRALNSTSSNTTNYNHVRKFDPEFAKAALGFNRRMLDEYQQQAEFLASKPARNEDVVSYFKRVFKLSDPKPKKDGTPGASQVLEQLKELLHSQPGANLGEGTWWAAFNCVTRATDHELGRSPDSRLYSAWFGGNEQRKQRALKVAIEMANT